MVAEFCFFSIITSTGGYSLENRVDFSDLDEPTLDLFRAACVVRERAFAPYSGFRVGAAIRLMDGSVYTGCNVENVSYGMTVCAERVAIFKAVSEAALKGAGGIVTIFVVTDPPEGALPAAPCGGCRSVIAQFDTEHTSVFASNVNGTIVLAWEMGELLPDAFERDFAAVLQQRGQ